jgi:hypothetical protein
MLSLYPLVCAGFIVCAAGCTPPPAPPSAASLAVSPPPPAATSSSTPAPASAAPTTTSPEPTDAELIEKYTPIWRALLARKNGVTVADVEHAISGTTTTIRHDSGANAFLVIKYTFSLDWVSMPARDQIVLHVDSHGPIAALFPGMTDRWLTEPELEALPDSRLGLATSLTPLPFAKHLKYASRAEAIKALPGTTGATVDDAMARILLARPEDASNDLYLEAKGGHVRGSTTECLWARLDLVTGKIERSQSYCGPVSGARPSASGSSPAPH